MTPDNRNLYSISDLADQVGVPRTTITDWLGKYARFIEVRTQGRRRFYTERTLSVLCKIAELRAAGRSSGDIDGELERVFPVHPTVEPPDAPSGTFAQDRPAEADGPAASPDAANPGQTYPVVKQENFDELYDLLGTRFTDLCDAMSAVNRKTDASARRLRMMFAVAVMIIVVLVCFLVLFYAYFRVQRLNTVVSRDTASAVSALAADSQTRENELRADLAAASGKVEELRKKNETLAGELSAASGKAEELQKKHETLENELSSAEKRVSGEAEARKQAEAEADKLRVDLAAASGKAEAFQNLRDDLSAQRDVFEAAIEEMKKNAGAELEAQNARFEARIALEKEQSSAEAEKLRADLAAVSGKADDIQKIRDDLPAQRKAFEAAIEEMKKSSASERDAQKAQFEAQILQERDQFAAERLKLLADLEAASGKLEELRKRNETLETELSAAEKRASDEAEARKKAEAEAENARRAAAPSQGGWYPVPPPAGQSAAQ